MQWALYYPPLSDASAGADADESCGADSASEKSRCLTLRAEQRLRLGRVDDAQTDIQAALALRRDDPDAEALAAVISIVKNDKASGLASGKRATELDPLSPRAWIAYSYAQQASFKLEDALSSAERAAQLAPRSSTAQTRMAELLMSLGKTRSAERAAQAAVEANPNESRAHTILGFVHLAQIDTKKARVDFLAAIERDSSDPLARLGLGLAIIRDGDLVAGREQIEIAVLLDPTNSLVRSYVGKAYYEENSKERDTLAASQFGLAKQLDPKDPTPWFYDAILKDSQTQPGAALKQVEHSIELNDERGIYRSKLLLDQDLAARTTSRAHIYNELGFTQLGLVAAAESISFDPSSYPAHKFLADMYATRAGHDIARASELLQSQLRQPLGAAALQPQLANDILFRTYPYGPSTVGPNEFSPLFMRDGLGLQLFGLAGEHGSWGEQAVIGGLRGPLSFSLSQFRADSDGFRANNENSQQQYDAFLQAQVSAATSLQFEATHSEQHTGDLQVGFDPAFFNTTQRASEGLDTQRFGLRQQISSQSDLLLSIIAQQRTGTVDIPDPMFPFFVVNTQQSWKAEAQYLKVHRGINFISGISYFDAHSVEQSEFGTATSQPFHINAYTYAYLPLPRGFPQLQLGASYDHLRSRDAGDQSQVNPKLGLIWKPTPPLTLRAAFFRVLKRRINSDQGLEPTQIAGFNQFFDDANGTKSRGAGAALDYRFTPTLFGGIEMVGRKLSWPLTISETGDVQFDERTERSGLIYVYWLPADWLSFSTHPTYLRHERANLFGELKSAELPLSVRLFLPSGVWAAVTLTGVWQKGQFVGPGGGLVDGADHFWTADALIAYRFPQRRGTVSLQMTNLLNRTFRFQDIVFGTPRFVPQRQVLMRISLEL
ncbi:MAG: TonB-dependent receptor [Betaproteobacteria bacterium]